MEQSENQPTETKHHFKKGQLLSFVRVRFPGHARSLPFHAGNNTFKYGQKVIAQSERGLTVGYVNSFPYQLAFRDDLLPIKSIKRSASDDDIQEQVDHYRKEKKYEMACKELIEKYELKMNLTHVEFTQNGKKVIFYFIAPERIDFRDLVRDLVGELKVRIELRQISLRDRSAAIGGIGSCGRQLCCSSFLKKYGQVNIKMAKNQDLTLNYDQLNGVCGQIKCCIKYEDEVYQHKSKSLPKFKSIVKTKQGDIGKVIRVDILKEQFTILTINGVKKRFAKEELSESLKNYKFPNRFDHISDETSNVIGQEKVEKRSEELVDKYEKELADEAKDFAEKTFSEYFD